MTGLPVAEVLLTVTIMSVAFLIEVVVFTLIGMF